MKELPWLAEEAHKWSRMRFIGVESAERIETFSKQHSLGLEMFAAHEPISALRQLGHPTGAIPYTVSPHLRAAADLV